MAQEDKTEKPTGKRRGEARERGQVARSPDLTSALVLAVGLIVVLMMGGAIVSTAGNFMSTVFSDVARPANVSSGAGLKGIEHMVLTALLKTIVPISLVCLLAGVVMNVLQVGLHASPKALRPNFSRINPMTGAKNLFGKQAVFSLGKSIAKFVVVGGFVALALVPDITHLGASVGTSPAALGALIRGGVMGIAIRVSVAYLAIGAFDFLWQRRQNENALKMTKQEVKDEHRQSDLPPEIKGALRRRQREQARARMMAAVPKADVVITNPTHFAVALQYDGERPAPVVVAKGQDLVALEMRRIAEAHDVPIVPDPPLARELYRTVEIDQMIPADLYAAVAQVLAFVYRLAARKRVGV